MDNATQIQASTYYIQRSYNPVYYQLYVALERWIADNAFREDISRVFLASDGYAFRRRFELTDMSVDYDDLDISSLRFPFANYWPLNSGWTPDTRIASNQASLIYTGIDIGTTHMRVAPGIISIPTTFYFDREDDARLLYDKLYFLTYNEHYYNTSVSYGENTIGLPMNISLKNLLFNPSTTEKDWLVKNRIFIVSVTFDVRSFLIYPPEQPNYRWEVDAQGNLYDGGHFGGEYDDGIQRYTLTEEVILNMEDMNDLRYSTITATGTVNESDVLVDRMYMDRVTSQSARLNWKLKNPDSISKILVYGIDVKNPIEVPLGSNFFDFVDLKSGSKYAITVVFYSRYSTSKKLGLNFETEKSKEQYQKEQVPTNALIGLKF